MNWLEVMVDKVVEGAKGYKEVSGCTLEEGMNIYLKESCAGSKVIDLAKKELGI